MWHLVVREGGKNLCCWGWGWGGGQTHPVDVKWRSVTTGCAFAFLWVWVRFEWVDPRCLYHKVPEVLYYYVCSLSFITSASSSHVLQLDSCQESDSRPFGWSLHHDPWRWQKVGQQPVKLPHAQLSPCVEGEECSLWIRDQRLATSDLRCAGGTSCTNKDLFLDK